MDEKSVKITVEEAAGNVTPTALSPTLGLLHLTNQTSTLSSNSDAVAPTTNTIDSEIGVKSENQESGNMEIETQINNQEQTSVNDSQPITDEKLKREMIVRLFPFLARSIFKTVVSLGKGEVKHPVTLNEYFKDKTDVPNDLQKCIDKMPNIRTTNLMKDESPDLGFYVEFLKFAYSDFVKLCPSLVKMKTSRNVRHHSSAGSRQESSEDLIKIGFDVIEEAKIVFPNGLPISQFDLSGLVERYEMLAKETDGNFDRVVNSYIQPDTEDTTTSSTPTHDSILNDIVSQKIEETLHFWKIHNVTTWMQNILGKPDDSEYNYFADMYLKPLVRMSDGHDEKLNVMSPAEIVEKEGHIVVTGESGVGKSSLAHSILYHWLQHHPSLSVYDILFYVDLNTPNSLTFYDYVHNVMPSFINGIDKDNLASALEKFKILFVIEELNTYNKQSVSLMKDIVLKYYAHKLIIFSSRDSSKTALTLVNRFPVKNLTMLGLQYGNEQQLFSNISRCISIEGDKNLMLERFTAVVNLWKARNFDCWVSPLDILLLITCLALMNHVFHLSPKCFDFAASRTHLFMKLHELLSARCATTVPGNMTNVLQELGEITADRVSSLFTSWITAQDLSAASATDNTMILSTFLLPLHSTTQSIEEKKNENLHKDLIANRSYSLESISSSDDSPKKKKNQKKRETSRKSSLEQKKENDKILDDSLPAVIFDKYTFFHDCQVVFFSATYLTEHLHQSKIVQYEVLLSVTRILAATKRLNELSSDIFKTAEKLRPTTQITEYNFWSDLVLASICPDSGLTNKVMCNKIEAKLKGLDWKLDSVNFSHAVNLLRNFLPRRKLLISWENNSELSTTISEMLEHMKKMLEGQHENVMEMSIMLDQNQLLRMDWISFISPWGAIVEFHGCIDTEHFTLLSQCSNLRILNLKLTSIESLNLFAQCENNWNSLQNIEIHLDFIDCDPECLNELKQLTFVRHDLEVLIDIKNVSSTSLQSFCRTMKDWLPR